jgi:uncharacterized protein YggE
MDRLPPAVAAVAVALLVALAGCAGQVDTRAAADGPAPGVAQVETDRTTVAAGGTGEATAAADRAVVVVAVTATDPAPDAARGAVAADVAAVREALRADGVADDAVRTLAFTVGPEYDDAGAVRAYRAVHLLAVETAPDAAGGVVDGAIGAGADEIGSVRFTLSDERRADLRDEAVARAVAAARADAETAAASADLALVGVAALSVEDRDDRPFFETAADRGGAGTEFVPGEVTVTATVRVTYVAEGA